MADSKFLCLIRHAKSSWKNPGLTDSERPLNERGQRDAPEMGRRLARRPVVPQCIISSPAVRALKTAEIIAAALGYERSAVVVEKRIYCADARELMGVVEKFDEQFDRVAMVGHNPGFSDLLYALADGAVGHMPTCSIATIGFKASEWGHIAGVPAELIDFDYPKKTS